MAKCSNCNNEFSGSYCSNCGQQAINGKLTIKMVLADFVNTVFLFDSSLYSTLKSLLIEPGKLGRAYLEGKRKAYLPPFQYFLLFMTLYLIVFNSFGEELFGLINSGLYEDSDQVNKALMIQTVIRRNLNIMYFVLTPIIACSIWLFYKKLKFNYAEVLIFALYIMGTGLFLSSIIALISLLEPELFVAKGLVTFGYYPLSIMGLTNSRSFAGFFKAFAAILVSYLAFLIMIAFFAILYVIAL